MDVTDQAAADGIVALLLPDVFELPTDNTDPTSGGGAATGRVPVKIGGATRYLAYY